MTISAPPQFCVFAVVYSFVCLFKTTRDRKDCSYVHGCVIIRSLASLAVDTSQERRILLPSISKYSLPICAARSTVHTALMYSA